MNNLSVYKELQKESLFNEWTDELIGLNSINGNVNFAVEIWNTAKDYAYSIATSVDPVGMFKICQSEIQKKDPPFCFNAYKTCLGCIYTMIIKSADKAVVEQIRKNIPVSNFGDFGYRDLQDKINLIVDKIIYGWLHVDYDYSKKKDSQNADANKGVTADNGKTQALEKRIQELEEELAEYKKGPIVDKPHNKVVLELFAKLLEESGVDFKVHGNKAIAARLAEYVTGIKKDACNKYMCYKDLSTSYHKDEVNKVNDQLRLLNINIKL